MYNVGNILVIIDPLADQQRALHRGVWLAQKCDAELELFLCDHHAALADGPFLNKSGQRKARESFLANKKKWLEELAAPLRRDGLEVETDVVWGKHFYAEIIRKSLRCGADLVVKGSEYHSKLRRTLFTSSDWQLIRECSVPVWFSKLEEISATAALIAAVDPMSSTSKPEYLNVDILNMATVLQQGLGADLHIAHWMDWRGVTQQGVPAGPDYEKLQAERMSELLQDFPVVDAGNVHLTVDRDEQFLLDMVREIPAQVVVMGALARGRVERMMLGSSAERMLDQLSCDVLVVKPNDFVSPVKL